MATLPEYDALSPGLTSTSQPPAGSFELQEDDCFISRWLTENSSGVTINSICHQQPPETPTTTFSSDEAAPSMTPSSSITTVATTSSFPTFSPSAMESFSAQTFAYPVNCSSYPNAPLCDSVVNRSSNNETTTAEAPESLTTIADTAATYTSFHPILSPFSQSQSKFQGDNTVLYQKEYSNTPYATAPSHQYQDYCIQPSLDSQIVHTTATSSQIYTSFSEEQRHPQLSSLSPCTPTEEYFWWNHQGVIDEVMNSHTLRSATMVLS
ncbi:hypothetical protein BDB00DRAFT_542774 [Zychaea mexicana]|uniref:uncharacterized protein n=1 Tax=Zychaea mexicana TaxID=64656 RepID=UPI0022FDB587|nr:uncharacterized protein BDB00DRAFT_542774 [Zychaea mexicana]KAI9497843.1 hypothetical protein BDB00DRAFT_542774 [Zychaea mexicana]